MKAPNQNLPEATRELHVPPPPIEPIPQDPEPSRGSWYLLTGIVLGLIFGLVYAWLVNPVVYHDTHPASMKDSFKDSYRRTIAQAYAETGNLDRAVSRLALLKDPDPVYALGAQAQQALAEGQPEEARALALLASALQDRGSMEVEPIPTATLPPIPTRTLPVNTSTP